MLTREWKAGDYIEFELPMEPQRVIADNQINADLGMTALRYGPLIYNVETIDNNKINQELSDDVLATEWRPDMLGGVCIITGKWKDGSPMLAIPNFARMNRVGPPDEYPNDDDINYSPGATTSAGTTTPSGSTKTATPKTPVTLAPKAGTGETTSTRRMKRNSSVLGSKVWI